VANRAGEYRSNLSGELRYDSFIPRSLPPDPPVVIDGDMIKLLTKANRSIGILEGMSNQVPDIDQQPLMMFWIQI